jgi:hypothetical protein
MLRRLQVRRQMLAKQAVRRRLQLLLREVNHDFPHGADKLKRAWFFQARFFLIELFLLQQRHKTGLLKMFIAGKRFFNAMISHDDEGCAIGERPIFIYMLIVMVERAVE